MDMWCCFFIFLLTKLILSYKRIDKIKVCEA
jgi:hypothetical protein